MDAETRQRVHELETTYRQYDPATAVNRLCVVVARLEAELVKAREERDRFATAIEQEYEGTSLGGRPAREIT